MNICSSSCSYDIVMHSLSPPSLPQVPPVFISFFTHKESLGSCIVESLSYLLSCINLKKKKMGKNSSETGNSGLCFFFLDFWISFPLQYFCFIESPSDSQQASHARPVLQAQEGQVFVFPVAYLLHPSDTSGVFLYP